MTAGEEKKLPLFREFAPVPTEQWEETIVRDLKGDNPDTLLWSTYEGITVKPFYRQEDLQELTHLGSLPGALPYVRGRKTGLNSFLNMASLSVDGDGKEGISKAAEALSQGADGIHFRLTTSQTFPVSDLIQEIPVAHTPLAFTLPGPAAAWMSSLLSQLQQNKVPVSALSGFLHHQPGQGWAEALQPTALEDLSALLDLTKEMPDFRVLAVDGEAFRNEGSTLVQEIAFTLSLAVSYLDQLTERGYQVEEVASNVQLLLAAGTDYFFEIAKLRALRLLWATVLKAYGAEAQTHLLRVHVTTSRWHQTTFDPHINLLRTTTEAMAAIIGGCDSLSVEPFDTTYQPGTPFSERLSRNIPLVLREEGYLDKAVDPAGGAYYLENLTSQLARKAWMLFQEIETMGGFAEAAKNGVIQQKIRPISRQKHRNIASGKDVFVGTNRYPNLQEVLSYDPEKLIQSKEFDGTRGAYPFEIMRMAAELHFRKKHQAPLAAIAVLGDSIELHINASFAQEFFSCANFETKVLPFETVKAAAAVLFSLPAKIIVLSCSPDTFARFGREFGPLLEKHPNRPALILASDPHVLKEEMIASGFDEFIFENCDTKEIITRIQKKLMEEAKEEPRDEKGGA
jgi:methylmalonyl-CoA mutase